MKIVTFKADDRLVEMIDRAAEAFGKCRSEIIREAIVKYLVELGINKSNSKAERRNEVGYKRVVIV